MASRFSRKPIGLSMAVAAILVVGAGVAIWQNTPTSKQQNTVVTDNRQTYANLYQAAWRQDDGTQPTLVTATLFLPPTIEALGRDTGRSSAEEQIWQSVRGVTSREVPIIVTLDSVSGAVADSVLSSGLAVTSVSGPTFVLKSWTPMIAPSHVVNTNESTTSQIGVAIFTADREVNWQTIQELRLTIQGLPSQSNRVFTWTEPRLLLQM